MDHRCNIFTSVVHGTTQWEMMGNNHFPVGRTGLSVTRNRIMTGTLHPAKGYMA